MDYEQTTEGIRVLVRPSFSFAYSEPEYGKFVFIYWVQMENHGEEEAQLIFRHWLIHDSEGEDLEVDGEYYAAEGYEKSYRWAHFDDVPFTPLPKPLAECTVTLVSTSDVALKADRGKNEQSHNSITGNVYSLPASTPADDLYSMQEHYDVNATHLDDVNSYFPITRLQEAAKAGRIGAVANRVHGVYTSYSHRKTLEVDGPEMLGRCREDGVDVAVMTPVCPVCHQTISLVARYLEESSIPTVVIATARDIVEHCGVARLVFVDFPLGR